MYSTDSLRITGDTIPHHSRDHGSHPVTHRFGQHPPPPTVTVTTPPTTQPTTGQGGTASVAIRNFAFVPGNLAVTRGTTVTWVNEDDAPHQVVNDAFGQTAQGAYFRSATLSKGAEYSFVFADAGVYQYRCSIHPSMRGTITVT